MNSQVENQKIFFIETLGCKVNQYESEAMREILLKSGFKECISKDLADIYIVNTCTVTHEADRESRHLIGLLHRLNPKARIVVTGCYVEEGSEAVSFLPGVSHIVKNEDKFRIAEILSGLPITDYPLPITNYESVTITEFKGHTKAFVKIQDGCDNLCSYCRIPLVRGRVRSKTPGDILKEVKALVENGFREIVLTGICLGAWGKDLESTAVARGVGLSSMSLVDVLKMLEDIKADFRIRLSSIEPKHVTDELIDYIVKFKRICRHLHIPLQSGDDDILKKMNRPYTAAEYKALIDRIRSKISDIAITTDVLIGFPGESDANFKNTLRLVREIRPSRTHIFTFSRRKGTAAYEMPGTLDKNSLKKRYCELNVASLESSYLYRYRFLNTNLDVLVETKRDRHSGLLTGYSDNYIKVLFEGPDELMKKIVPVKMIDLNLTYTIGKYECR